MERFGQISSDDPRFQRECSALADDITLAKTTITQLVEDLAGFLIDGAATNREKGTLILSSVLDKLSDDVLTAPQLNFISTFYSDRLNDHHQVLPQVLKGLVPLVRCTNLPDGAATKLLSSLFHNVSCQQQQQADRHNIYAFFQTVLRKREAEIKAMGLDFVYGVISAIDGERDPRNLLFLFSWLLHFLRAVDLGHLTDEMFEIMACYFPVDFRAPTQDPNSITRESLSKALRPCLCAVPEFSDHCLQLILEKLPSELQVAKLDSLDLLIESCDLFPAKAYVPHCTELWSVLLKEILNGNNDVETKSLAALTHVLKKLSDEECHGGILRDIIDAIKGNLRPDTKLFEASSKTLIAATKASKNSARFVAKEIVPLLINLYHLTNTAMHRIAIFNLLVGVAKICLDFDFEIDDLNDLKMVPNLCLAAMADRNCGINTTGLDGFAYLVEYIPLDVRNCFYENLLKLIVVPQDKPVRDSLLRCFKTFGRNYPEEVLQLVGRIEHNGPESLHLYLETVAAVVTVEGFTKLAVEILFGYAVRGVEPGRISQKILRNLLDENHAIVCPLLGREAVVELVDWFSMNSSDLNPERDCDMLDNFKSILNWTVGYLGEDAHDVVVNLVGKISMKTDVSVVALNGLLVRLYGHVSAIDVLTLCDVCLTTDSFYLSNVSAQLLANLVNKTTDDDKLTKTLNVVDDKCRCFNTNINSDLQVQRLINLVAFITKALIVRGHRFGDTWTDKLMQLTEKYDAAAKGFEIIVDDDYDCLSSINHCNRKLLYRQKFFVQVTNVLSANYTAENDKYLLIFGYMLQKVPKRVLEIEFRKVINLVVACLEKCQVEEILCAVLTTLCGMIENKDAVAEEYVREFVMRFLKLSTFEKSMKVRMLALQGVRLYATNYSVYELLPLQQEVIQALGRCLDDGKRLVRKEAVEARSRWFLLDAPI